MAASNIYPYIDKYIYFIKDLLITMNRFESFAEDDEEDFATTPTQKPPKKSHQQRKQAKQQKIEQAQKVEYIPGANENLPEKIKENVRNKKYHQHVPPKELTDGHYLDRRSGTGRPDRPRKEGGGRGNVGNIHDQFIKDKYLKEGPTAQGQEATVQAAEKKPEEPEGITLDEYYRNKGIDVAELAANKREPTKKGEINADWIKKEKLTVIETKEDKKANENKPKQQERREFIPSIEAEDPNLKLLGFGSKPNSQKPERREEQAPKDSRQNKDVRKGGKKTQEKVVISQQDFPAL